MSLLFQCLYLLMIDKLGVKLPLGSGPLEMKELMEQDLSLCNNMYLYIYPNSIMMHCQFTRGYDHPNREY